MIARLLIANRGEIAIRIARTAAEMGVATVAVFAEDDAHSPHVRETDDAQALTGSGAAAYLDIAAVIAAARAAGCDAVHPGYGFLSENAAFAEACADAGLTFVGPAAETLALFGDKSRARAHARSCGVPVLAGSSAAVTLAEARDLLDGLGPGASLMLKAVAGGGGRGMRPVAHGDDLAAAFTRCSDEAAGAFGDGRLYVEQLMHGVRHIEVQVVGDGSGAASHLWTRECSLQRRRQKLVEWAPAEHLTLDIAEALLAGAVAMAEAAQLKSLCTFEFLVEADKGDFAFIEANPRLQVEHTVTEEITGVDLVRLQLEIAQGGSLASLRMEQASIPAPRGTALQARVNMETMTADGNARPASGTITSYAPATGRGVRIDGYGCAGYAVSPRYDSLLAKVVCTVSTGGVAAAAAKVRRALGDFSIGGVQNNLGFLRALLADPRLAAGEIDIGFVDAHTARLVAVAAADDVVSVPPVPGGSPARATVIVPDGAIVVAAPMIGTLVAVGAAVGDSVTAAQEVAVMEAMKMQHGVLAGSAGTIVQIIAEPGDTLSEGDPILALAPAEATVAAATEDSAPIDLDVLRPDLAEIAARRQGTRDTARPEAVARRRRTGQRTARENIDDLCDPDSFVEYGALTIAGRSRRATTDELIAQSPADGLVMGLGTVNAESFGAERARVAAMSYDYTVFAGTQGARNHSKTDRMVELADRWRLPLVVFTEGGGGRPGDTDGGGFIRAFELFGKLSARAPLIGVVSGRCFAGNAALLGCCDVVIATKNVTIGMGGPAMIEGGGLGVFKPEEVGPASIHVAGGVIDVLVEDEAAAVAVAKQYLAYFQGALTAWSCADQRLLRHAVPENRLRVYDIRAVVETLADSGSVLELRRGFGLAMVTALARIEGRPVGIIANDPAHLGGAIDSDAADKAARFMQLCEAYDLPLVSLSDTPGIMVGPEAEKTGLVRHAARMFVIGGNLTVPILSVVLRKSYGLGAIAMTGGSYQASMFAVSWPSGEFGGMGLEGAVKLGYRKELEAIADPAERHTRFEEMVERLYQHGKALTTASYFGIDDVIDPADTRHWIGAALRSVPAPAPPKGKKIPWVDPW